jgi:hypothetical protein
MTQCKRNRSRAQAQMSLDLGTGKEIIANFDGGRISSDGGILLLRKADERLELTETASFCFPESRRADAIRHSALELFRQRVYGIAHLYEDCNDANFLRHDDMHKLAVGKLPSGGALASQPTLSRFENAVDDVALKAMQEVLVHAYVRMHKKRLHRRRPRVVRLQMDTSCDETHGYQQMTFYNGFYETECYVPLFIFTEDGFPLASLLRAGNAAPAEGALRMLKMVVHNLRMAWPEIRIELVADAAFGIPEIYNWCEDNEVTYYVAIKSNAGLDYHTKELVVLCKEFYDRDNPNPSGPLKHGETSKAERYRAWRQSEERKRFAQKANGRMQEHFEQDTWTVRCFHSFQYDAREWRYKRRIVARVQFDAKGPDVRYVVTNSTKGSGQAVYEKYCLRARCENWIKDLKNYLLCDRTSCQEFNANQFRLLMHTFALALMWDLKVAAGLEHATVETVRLHLLKVGVAVVENSRHVRLRLASHHPHQARFLQAWDKLVRAG